jgi:hypothetical protein
MQTVHGWVKEVYAAKGIVDPDLPPEGDRTGISSPALDGVFLLGKGFLNFDNTPYGFITDEVRRAHPNVRWAVANAERGSLLSLFMHLTVATSSIEGAWLDPLPYLASFRVQDLEYGI